MFIWQPTVYPLIENDYSILKDTILKLKLKRYSWVLHVERNGKLIVCSVIYAFERGKDSGQKDPQLNSLKYYGNKYVNKRN